MKRPFAGAVSAATKEARRTVLAMASVALNMPMVKAEMGGRSTEVFTVLVFELVAL